MAILRNETQRKVLLTDLSIAKTPWTRMKGLLGTDALAESQGLWIHACNSVHTFFMKYPIDCVFLDRNLVVRSLVNDVKPGRIVWPRWGASSVIETRAGWIERSAVKVGDQLHVGT